MRIRCLGCHGRFSGNEQRIKKVVRCPKCKLDGLWWEKIDKIPIVPSSVSGTSTATSPSTSGTVSNVPLAAGNSLIGESNRGVFSNIKTKHIAIVVVCLISLVGFIGGTAWFISGDTQSGTESVEDLTENKSPPSESQPAPKRQPEAKVNTNTVRIEHLERTLKYLFSESRRFNSQAVSLFRTMKTGPEFADFKADVELLRREYDAMLFGMPEEYSSHEYITELTDFLEYYELSVKAYQTAAKLGDLAKYGRFSHLEVDDLLERAIRSAKSVNHCKEQGSDAYLRASKVMSEMRTEISRLKK